MPQATRLVQAGNPEGLPCFPSCLRFFSLRPLTFPCVAKGENVTEALPSSKSFQSSLQPETLGPAPRALPVRLPASPASSHSAPTKHAAVWQLSAAGMCVLWGPAVPSAGKALPPCPAGISSARAHRKRHHCYRAFLGARTFLRARPCSHAPQRCLAGDTSSPVSV